MATPLTRERAVPLAIGASLPFSNAAPSGVLLVATARGQVGGDQRVRGREAGAPRLFPACAHTAGAWLLASPASEATLPFHLPRNSVTEDRSEFSRCSLYPHNQRVLTTPETTPWKRQPRSEQVTGRAAKPAKGESAESLRPRRR